MLDAPTIADVFLAALRASKNGLETPHRRLHDACRDVQGCVSVTEDILIALRSSLTMRSTSDCRSLYIRFSLGRHISATYKYAGILLWDEFYCRRHFWTKPNSWTLSAWKSVWSTVTKASYIGGKVELELKRCAATNKRHEKYLRKKGDDSMLLVLTKTTSEQHSVEALKRPRRWGKAFALTAIIRREGTRTFHSFIYFQ